MVTTHKFVVFYSLDELYLLCTSIVRALVQAIGFYDHRPKTSALDGWLQNLLLKLVTKHTRLSNYRTIIMAYKIASNHIATNL